MLWPVVGHDSIIFKGATTLHSSIKDSLLPFILHSLFNLMTLLASFIRLCHTMSFSFFHLFLFLSHLSSLVAIHNVSVPSCPHFQKSALLMLFSSRSSLPSWKSDGSDCCDWEGVTCDQSTGHVTILDISGLSISSSINSTAFTILSSLRVLNLSNNNFNSSIPSHLDSLSNLTHLNLSNSLFIGQIPLAISRLSHLISLDISTRGDDSPKLEDPGLAELLQNLSLLEELHLNGVNISSTVPEFLSNFTALRRIHLSDCGLLGVFPRKIFHLPKLQALDLSSNYHLNGSFPEFSQGSDLQELMLADTGFSGRLPNSFGYLKKLTRLWLHGCAFSGPIPSSMGDIAGIIDLDLSKNGFVGTILPLKNLTQLVYLSLGENNFIRPITPLAQLTKLNHLDLRYNEFTGPISPLVQLTKLSYLDLSNNNFTGMITVIINGLPNLSTLFLGKNSLYGKIPSAVFTLPSLHTLDLSQNCFNDTLDEFINGFQSFEFIDLSKNNLQGPIPRSIFNLSSLRILYLSSNNFIGKVKIAMLQKNLLSLDLGDNLLSIDDVSANNSSSIPSFRVLVLRSCNLMQFPNFLRNQSTVNYLDLSNNKIHGEIPGWIWTVGNREIPDSILMDGIGIEDMFLSYLNLSFNLLSSFKQSKNISFGSWTILDLHSNKLHGSIPLPSLYNRVLDYSNNCFTYLPAKFTSHLNFFSISDNNVSGEIPKSICTANFLKVLDLSNNKLKGSIPECLVEMSTKLVVLDLRNNGLSGTIPEIFKVGCTLRTLNLNGNRLYGKVQRSLGNCTELEVLDLGNNQISDLIPSYWDSLMNLRVLVLRSNKFHGTIMQFDNFSFPKLQIIDLSSNNFSGNLPEGWFKTLSAMRSSEDNQVVRYGQEVHFFNFDYSITITEYFYYQNTVNVTSKNRNLELVKIRTIFTSIDLSNNNFEGAIPKVLGTLNWLHVLNMSGNDFSGSIPTSIGNMTQLESLDLSQNKLSGEIPSELMRLTFLAVLNLSHNQLSGPIPQGRQFLTFTNESYNGNPRLCGVPLSRRCNLGPVLEDVPTTDEGVDSESKSNINWFLISALVGLFVGLGTIFFPLLFWRKWRRWYFKEMDKMLEKFPWWCQVF